MLDIYLVVAEVYKENKKGAIFLKHFYQCPLQQHFAPSLVPFYFRLFLFWQIWKFPIIVHQIWNETEVHFHNILYIAGNYGGKNFKRKRRWEINNIDIR